MFNQRRIIILSICTLMLMIRLIMLLLILSNVACQSNTAYVQNTRQMQTNEQPMVAKIPTNNILNEKIEPCCFAPLTGYFRDGFCHFDEDDYGVHLICAVMTDDYLQFSKSLGNDLITPKPERRFPGLKAGDKWCLCVSRWEEAYRQGVAPKIDLHATHQKVAQMIPIDIIMQNAIE